MTLHVSRTASCLSSLSRQYNRTSIARYEHITSRAFSTSPRREFVVEALTTVPNFAMTTLHTMGLPWYAIIPATALLFRGVIGFSAAVDLHKRAAMRSALVPLKNAVMLSRGMRRSRAEELRNRDGSKMAVHPDINAGANSFRIRHELDGKYKAGLIFNKSFMWQFALILTCAEAIRMKAGLTQGLLGLTASIAKSHWPLSRIFALRNGAAVQEPYTAASVIGTAETLPPVADKQTIATLATDSSPGASEVAATSSSTLWSADPSMTTEGLSWCTDLTAADPTGILPNTVLIMMLAQIALKPSRTNAANFVEWLRTFNGLDWAMVGFAFYIRLCGDSIPACLLLYFTSSLLVGKLVSIWLWFSMPIQPQINPCKHGWLKEMQLGAPPASTPSARR